jgi:phosphohistidine swiveling domain-containing protein
VSKSVIKGIGLTEASTSGILTTEIHPHQPLGAGDSTFILLTRDLTPDLVGVIAADPTIIGIVTPVGSVSSHAAVLLRELSAITGRAISGVGGISYQDAAALEGQVVSVDGPLGMLRPSLHGGVTESEQKAHNPEPTLSRPEKSQLLSLASGGGEWRCTRPTYRFSLLEQSLITPGYAHSPVTLLGGPPCKIQFDAEGRMWQSGGISAEDLAAKAMNEGDWLGSITERQHRSFSRILRQLLARRESWLALREEPTEWGLVEALSYITQSFYHLYRYLPLTSNTYPFVFRELIQECQAAGANEEDSLALLRSFGRTSSARQAVRHAVFPILGKSVLEFRSLSAPYATQPATDKDAFNEPYQLSLRSVELVSLLDPDIVRTVKLLFEAKDEKFYLSATLQSWLAWLLHCTEKWLSNQGMSPIAFKELMCCDVIQLAQVIRA